MEIINVYGPENKKIFHSWFYQVPENYQLLRTTMFKEKPYLWVLMDQDAKNTHLLQVVEVGINDTVCPDTYEFMDVVTENKETTFLFKTIKKEIY